VALTQGGIGRLQLCARVRAQVPLRVRRRLVITRTHVPSSTPALIDLGIRLNLPTQSDHSGELARVVLTALSVGRTASAGLWIFDNSEDERVGQFFPSAVATS